VAVANSSMDLPLRPTRASRIDFSSGWRGVLVLLLVMVGDRCEKKDFLNV